ncbi:protein OSB [Salix suchowensis]|nr:protein OSB [Salix suchowensis]
MFQFSTMALEQTLALSSTTSLFFSFPKNPITNIKIPILSPNPLSSSSEKSLPKRSLICSVDYRDNHYSQTATHAKPDEIQWNKELCNSVHLIGVVGIPVEIKHLPSGKVVAWTRLLINLTFWDELAHVASQHVEKGQQIYVAGRLISDSVENDDGKLQTYYKVVVQQLNFIERSSPTGLYDRGSNNMEAEERWQAFFANPMEWWDNRKDKRNPKYPDFKHKDTGEALWVEGRYNPSWVKSQLAILDERMGSLRDQDSRMRLSSMSGDDFMSFS